MDNMQVQKIIQSPQFIEMAKKKTSLGKTFTLITLIIYFGYLLMIGFNKGFFATSISPGSATTIGIYIGFAIVLFAVIITGIYVVKANGELDNMASKIVDEINSGKI